MKPPRNHILKCAMSGEVKEELSRRIFNSTSRLPPVERVRSHYADQLLELLTVDSVDALIEGCHDPEIRQAFEHLFILLVARRDGRRR